MATMKRKSVKLGKEIRKATGVPLPVAMRAGKFIARLKSYEVMMNIITKDYVVVVNFDCGANCCGFKTYAIRGPRGEYEFL